MFGKWCWETIELHGVYTGVRRCKVNDERGTSVSQLGRSRAGKEKSRE